MFADKVTLFPGWVLILLVQSLILTVKSLNLLLKSLIFMLQCPNSSAGSPPGEWRTGDWSSLDVELATGASKGGLKMGTSRQKTHKNWDWRHWKMWFESRKIGINTTKDTRVTFKLLSNKFCNHWIVLRENWKHWISQISKGEVFPPGRLEEPQFQCNPSWQPYKYLATSTSQFLGFSDFRVNYLTIW